MSASEPFAESSIKHSPITIISIFSLVAITFVIPNVKADSGWDSSYDGGGGSWSSGGGSWSSGGRSSSLDSGGSSWSGSGSSSGSYSGSSFTFLLVIICVVLFIYFTKDNTGYKASTRSSREALYKEIEDDKILGMPLEEFKALVFEKYKDIQIAWMNFDYDTLRKLTTDEIYNSYKMQLDVLRMKKQKNIMKDFELKGVKVDPKDMAHIEAIILSMTPYERRHPEVLKATRKQRIAKGSGRSVEEVNRLLKQFEEMKKMMKMMSNGHFKMPF